MWIAYDIETIPNEKKAKEYFTKVKKYRPPATTKDPEKIQKWIANKTKENIEKAGLYWFTGQVICICVEEVISGKKEVFYEAKDEKKLLNAFQDYIFDRSRAELIGKSCLNFDHPFLIGRMLANNLENIHRFKNLTVTDVDRYFAWSTMCQQTGSLDTYAYGLGLELKPFDGSQVYPLYKAGEHTTIQEYCSHDVHLVAEMARRFYKTFFSNLNTQK